MEYIYIILLIICIICIIGIIIPILFSSFLKFLVYNSFFKQDKINFKELLKKSWFFSFLGLLSILICSIVFSSITKKTDNLLIRIIVSSGFAFILLSLNYINLKKIEPINSINKKSFINFYAISFSSSLIIIGLIFYATYPNKIIKLKNISDFNDKISHIYACDSNLKNINLNITQSKEVLYAEYNKTDERIVIIKKLEKDQEKNLFSKFLFKKINLEYLESNNIFLNNEAIIDPTKKFEINDFETNIIGQSIVYSYSIEKQSFLLDFATSYHYNYYESDLSCDNFKEHVLNVDLFYDKLSKCLVLVGEIHRDGS